MSRTSDATDLDVWIFIWTNFLSVQSGYTEQCKFCYSTIYTNHTNFSRCQHWNGFFLNQRRLTELKAFTAQSVQKLERVYTSPRKVESYRSYILTYVRSGDDSVGPYERVVNFHVPALKHAPFCTFLSLFLGLIRI